MTVPSASDPLKSFLVDYVIPNTYSERPRTERSVWQTEHNCVRILNGSDFGRSSANKIVVWNRTSEIRINSSDFRRSRSSLEPDV